MKKNIVDKTHFDCLLSLYSILIFYGLLRLVILFTYPSIYVPDGDAAGYLSISKLSLFSHSFYYSRPFFYPLFLKVLNQNTYAIVLVQCIISILAWWLIATFVLRKLYDKQKKIAGLLFILILLFSCSLKISQWDSLILSESLTISFLTLFFYVFLKLAENKFQNYYLTITLSLIIIIFSNLRDSNVYFVLFLIPLYLYLLLPAQNKITVITLIIISLLSFIFSNFTSDKGQRWAAPFGDVLSHRLSYYPQVITYFTQHGMPADGKVILQKLQGNYDADKFMTNTGKYKDYPASRWFRENGKKIYTEYLLTHPFFLLSPFIVFSSQDNNVKSLNNITNSVKSIYDPLRSSTLSYHQQVIKTSNNQTIIIYLPAKTDFLSHHFISYKHEILPFSFYILYLLTFFSIVVTNIILIIAIIFSITSRKLDAIILPSCWYILCASLLTFLVIWHAGGMETERHELLIYQIFFLSSCYILVYLFSGVNKLSRTQVI